MSRTIELIPKVSIGGIEIDNLATGEKSWTSVDNLFSEGETISITYNPASRDFKDAIREVIRESIIGKLIDAKNNGIGVFTDVIEGSPPTVISLPDDDVENFVNSSYGAWGGIQAEYSLVKVGSRDYQDYQSNPIFHKLDRIFLSAPPSIKYDTCEYFNPDKDKLLEFEWKGKKQIASCGFQYFYQTYSPDSNYKKFVYQGKSKSKYKTKDSFERIKYFLEKEIPPQYEAWKLLYRDWMKKKNLDNCIVKPVEQDVIEELSGIDEISVIDLSLPEYSELEKYNSMSIDDIVRLCMFMELTLVVFDEWGDLMLCYDKNNEYHNNKKGKGGIVVVKVVDNHGYFIKRGDKQIVNKFCARGKHGFGGFYPSAIDCVIGNNGYAPKDGGAIVLSCADCKIIKHPKAMFKQNELSYEWLGLGDNPTQEKFEEVKRLNEAPHLKKSPPPTPQELIGMMDTGAIYYVGKTNLNGIVDYLQKNRPIGDSSIEKGEKKGCWKIIKSEIKSGIKPNPARGLPTAIHKATYGKLKLIAYHQHPTTGYKYPEDFDGELSEDCGDLEKECLDKWKEDFPTLKKYAIPTPSVMGKAIFDSLKLDCSSRMNDKTRDIFFQGEIKPDFRATSPTHTRACAFSLDFSKAYSNAARFMDCEWEILDAIDEPRYFREGSEFVDSAFYLCEELETGFPYKDLKGKGLALYHGCLLRHLAGKVKPIYIINSHKKLPKDYFVEFVEKCFEIAGDGSNNVVSAKQLVNTTFGGLKNKGGIKDYKLIINNDIVQLNKSFAQGSPVFNLDKGNRWKGSSFITARGNYQHNFLSGQPVRLQIMERINELNLLLDSAVRQSLNRDIHLLLVKTDALYYQYPDGDKWEMKDYYWNNLKFNPHKDLDIEDINSRLPEGYNVNLEHPSNKDCCKQNPVEVRDNWTSAPKTLNQYPAPKLRTSWKDTDTEREAWGKSKIKKILYKYYEAGGLYCRGEGGVGKTEIIKGIDEICRKNRQKLMAMNIFLKYLDNKQSIIKEWREIHPCFVKKLAPTNKACNNIGGKTLHRGLGLKVCGGADSDDEDEEEEKTDYDRVSKLVAILEKNKPDVMCVDEISMIGGEGWSVLSYIKFRIPKIKFFLFGDIKRQLPPVGEEKRKFEDSICMKELSNYNKLELKYNFRRQTADTNTLWDLCSDKPESFQITNSPLTYRNLCWTNKTRKEVIDKIQNIHPNPALWIECGNKEDPDNTGQNQRLMLAVGTPLIARKSIKDREVAKNEIWEVKSINSGEIVLEFKDREETFTPDEIQKKWLSAYCITIHKSQGDTYTDEYTIWDWGWISKRKDSQSKKLRYTAVSRSVNYEDLVKFK